MTELLPVTYKILPLYGLIGLGYIGGKLLHINKDAIAKLLIYLIVPVVIFQGAATAQLNAGLLLLPVVIFIIATTLCLLLVKLVKPLWSDSTANILAFMAGTGNTGYFGLPIAIAIFGDASVSILVFAILGNILYENTVGFYVIARSHHTSIEAVKRLLALPTLYAFIIGLLVNISHFPLPNVVQDVFVQFRGCYTVLGMMMIGLGLSAVTQWKLDYRFLTVSLGTKFVVWPLAVSGLVWIDDTWFHFFSTDIHHIILLCSIVPLAANAVSFATLFKVHPDKTAVAVMLSTILALIYIPIMVQILGL